MGVDEHVAGLAGEAERPTLHGAVDDHAATDPGAQGDEHAGGRPGGGAQRVLGQGGAVGVVVHDDRPCQARRERADQVEVDHARQVGGEAQHPAPVDETGGADADGARSAGARRRELVVEGDHHTGDGLDDGGVDTGAAPRRVDPAGRDRSAGGCRARRHAEHLGPPEVDAHHGRDRVAHDGGPAQ